MRTVGMYIVSVAALIQTLIALAWAKGNKQEPIGLDRVEPRVG